jgi:5-methylcytosine-specific restriction endonuclease McrA
MAPPNDDADANMWASQRAQKRRQILKRDGSSCCYCGKECAENSLTIEHLKPVSRGGSNHISNLKFACKPCNQKNGNSETMPFYNGDDRR